MANYYFINRRRWRSIQMK